MSAIRQPTSTARTLGDAVPVILTRFGEKRAPASEGKKIGDIQAEHQEWLDGQQTTAGCVECPDWSFTGPASEARAAAAAHRASLHPELVGRRTFRKKGRIEVGKKAAAGEVEKARAARAEREDQERLENILRGRRLRGELEETPETTGAGSGVSSSPTTTDQEENMETLARPTKPHGYWTVERIVDGFKEHARITGHAPATTLLNGSLGDRPDYLPSYTSMLKVATYKEILAAAGLEKPKRAAGARGSYRRKQGAKPEPVPAPDPLPPAAEHAALVPAAAAPPGRTSSRLVQILSRLTSEDLEESADWYTAAIQQLEHERDLITQAIEAKAA